jgi:hypothetical protein
MLKLNGEYFFDTEIAFKNFRHAISIAAVDWFLETVGSDVQTYLEEKLNKVFTDFDIRQKYDLIEFGLISNFRSLKDGQYQQARDIYISFIKEICRHHHFGKKVNTETELITSQIGSEGFDFFENTENNSRELFFDDSRGYLSAAERAALAFIKYRNIFYMDMTSEVFKNLDMETKKRIAFQKERLRCLENFTERGIMQLANRAGLKVLFNEKKISN